MNRTDLDTMLTTLDPARDTSPGERMRVDLEHILAHDLDNGSGALASPVRQPATGLARGRRRITTRLVAAGFGLAVAGSTFLLASEGSVEPARAWTPQPAVIANTEEAQRWQECRDFAWGRGSHNPDQPLSDLRDARPLVMERRGEWVATLFESTEHGLQGFCLLPDEPDRVEAAGMDGQLRSGEATYGYYPTGHELPADAVKIEMGQVQHLPTESAWALYYGFVGEDVESLDVLVPDGTVIESMVTNGRFIVWWPGSQVQISDTDMDAVRFVAHHADGTSSQPASVQELMLRYAWPETS